METVKMKQGERERWVQEFNKIPVPKGLVAIPSGDFIISPEVTKNPLVYDSSGRSKSSLYVTPETLERLYVVKKNLRENEGLEIYQAYRDNELLTELWDNEVERVKDRFPDFTEKQVIEFASQFVASPYHPNYPPHSRGDAIDVELWKDGRPAKLIEEDFDYDKIRFDYYKDKDSEIHGNRVRLREIMTSAGFIPYDKEYWHFGLTPVWEDEQ